MNVYYFFVVERKVTYGDAMYLKILMYCSCMYEYIQTFLPHLHSSFPPSLPPSSFYRQIHVCVNKSSLLCNRY